MPEETPSFFSQPLPEETVKPKRRTATRKHTTTHPQRKPKNKATPTIDTKKISRQLDSIYRDENGRIPDMSRIKIKKESSFLKKFFIFIIIISFLAAAAWAGFFLMPNKNFSDNQVNIVINGPDNIIFGATSTYEVIISNNQSVEIKNVNLNLRYPESFVFISSSLPATNKGNTEWNLNDISGNKEQKIQISGVYYGVLEQDQSWRASVRYQPENFNSELQRSAVKTVKITHSPYSLTITGPDKAAVGSEVEYLITLEDREGKPNQKFIIRNTFPNNFYITTSSPILEKDNNWIFVYSPIINTSTTSTTNTANLVLPLRQIFSVKGKFVDSEQNKTTLRSELLFVSNQDNYQIDESTITTELVRNSVSLEMAINGSTENITTRPGEQLNITIAAKNDSKDKLSKASINIYFDAPAYKRQSVIDWAKITDKSDGDVVGKQISDTIRQAKITWNGSKLNTLNNWKPNQEVQFNFQVPIKDTKTIDWDAVKESKIIATPEITFTDPTGVVQIITGKPMTITINSDFNLEVRDEIEIINGKENHNITWVINNTIHPLKEITLSADIYGDVNVGQPISAPAGKVVYDSKEKKITWTIEQMSSATDVLALPFTITLNQKNPTQNLLVGKVRVQAIDTVTQEKLEIMGEEVPLKIE